MTLLQVVEYGSTTFGRIAVCEGGHHERSSSLYFEFITFCQLVINTIINDIFFIDLSVFDLKRGFALSQVLTFL